MSQRLPKLAPGDLDEVQRGLYGTITGGPRAQGPQVFDLCDERGALNGPFNAMLYAPELGAALQEVGSAVRYRTGLSARVRELAILMVAAAWDSEFERHAHEAIGPGAGLSAAEMRAVREGTRLDLADPAEATAIGVVRALLETRDLDAAGYETAVNQLGAPTLVELTALVGYYSTLALQLRVFRVTVADVD